MVAKGSAYSEDASTNDDVVLRAQKFGQAIRIAEEDIDDTLADVLDAKKTDWSTGYAKTLDNACLAVTAAKGTSGCAFDSLYYLLTQTDSNTSYTANANITQTATGAPAITFANLSTAAGIYESGDYFEEDNTVVIASSKYKKLVRDILDSQDRPIFQEGSTGVPGGGQGKSPDTIFGYPVHWSLGARTSAAPTASPGGNPLLVFCNPMYLLVGTRSGPESVFIDGRNGLAALTDESILKMRARRAFAPGVEQAFSILEQRA
jgi:HK97 family phage major capsid protein